jgi:hypothetical protein
VVGDRLMGILDERFRDCICLNIYDRIDGMRVLGESTMANRAKSLERRIR